ncbi:MAG: hypothetical protein OXU64_03085 [Gemmatimonadota bacterium]|nr:hypothetical protein [Deltaproteobacteria bacterium]MDE2973698.1 hypothetical protein [Gemmatimonadota bacterium]
MSRWDAAREPERQTDPRQTGHRREFQRRRQRRQSFAERKELALTDVAVFRTVSVRDLAVARFGGHPFTTRKAINSMVRSGWMREHTVKGPKGGKFQVLTVTPKGARRGNELAAKYGLAEQATWSGLVKKAEVRHDVAVYRAAQAERAKLEDRGCIVERIRIDAEMKREVARATASRAAALERRRVARQLGLPVREGKVLVPDAQLQYHDPDGRAGRVNIEVVSEHYSGASIAAKAAAGFSIHSAGSGGSAQGGGSTTGTRVSGGTAGGGRTAAKIAAALGSAAGSGSRSGGGRGGGRARGSIEL